MTQKFQFLIFQNINNSLFLSIFRPCLVFYCPLSLYNELLQFQILLGIGQYNHLRPNFQQLISIVLQRMSFYDNLWDISHEEHSFAFSNLYFEPERQDCPHRLQETDELSKNLEGCIELPVQSANQPIETRPEQNSMADPQFKTLHQRKTSIKQSAQEENKRRRKKIKPSPYHNFQKHLNTALRHILTFPSPQANSQNSVLIAQRLWTVFLHSDNSTKKILSFIFNEFNEYRIKPNELRDFGFDGIYAQCTKAQLAQAKTFLTEMAIDQINEENVNDYLETRRIKNAEKFKKYLWVFRKELKDGFLKKRFTNRSRKQQILKELTKMSE